MGREHGVFRYFRELVFFLKFQWNFLGVRTLDSNYFREPWFPLRAQAFENFRRFMFKDSLKSASLCTPRTYTMCANNLIYLV